ncbi:MAG TPA: helicase-related protein, partial [Gemmatimonadaceae bacterium]|nr:helicase-related protein [Gemmatimonadaceae bacterium]
LLNRNAVGNAIVFTRTKHRANRLFESCEKAGISVARIHGNRSQAQRTDALEGFKSGRYRVLVATDIAARGIDVEALGHVINFDVPAVPEDYIHRVGRTARAELTGEAYTFVSPEEEHDLGAIERAVGKRLPRVVLPDFDYRQRPAERFEVPIGERIAAIRSRKADDRARAKAKLERRNGGNGNGSTPPPRPHPSRGPAASRGEGSATGGGPRRPSAAGGGRSSSGGARSSGGGRGGRGPGSSGSRGGSGSSRG